MPEQLRTILANLRSFGARRLIAMASVASVVFAVIGVGAVVLNKPAYETLYVGLDRSDINQIGMVLGENGIAFDVGSDGASVLVGAGSTPQARMLLAEKGLPASNNAGYELFDNVGSLGLTSFMQEVTRVRALEGEIARTIQTISGVKAARVHLVMSEHANFRREEQQPTASVVIRYAGSEAERSAVAIRHLVAAAVPGLSVDKVTVLDSNGALLAAGDDPSNSSLTRSIGIERTVEGQVEENIHRALAPYLGSDNFRASVSADVNTDVRQIEETFFDPDSRVERSVQTVKSQDATSKSGAQTPTSVDQNLPDQSAAPKPSGAEASNSSERKEEITNYEINSRKVATVSNGYSISKLSIAVVVNEARLKSVLGADATQEKIDARIADIQKVVASAAGFNQTRGDSINVTSVEFMAGEMGEAEPKAGIMEAVTDRIGAHAGTLINAGAFIAVALLVVFFGLRPLVAAMSRTASAGPEGFPHQFALGGGGQTFALPDPTAGAGVGGLGGRAPGGLPPPSQDGGDDIGRRVRPAPQERLTRMLDLNEERTALILRKWAGQEAA